jgi:hypothetical protein
MAPEQHLHKLEHAYIAVKHISVVWVQSQRPYSRKWAEEIRDNLDPDLFFPICVTKADANGTYHVVDGQHRKSALEMAYGLDEKCPCMVVNADNPAKAAKIFQKLNKVKSQSKVTQFKIAVTAKDETEVKVNAIVLAAGYHIDSHRSEKAISAVSALSAVYQKSSADILKTTLQVIQATWGWDPAAVVGPIIQGYGAFLTLYAAKVDFKRLRECMAKRYSPGKLQGSAKSAREVSGGTHSDAIRRIITATYNRGLRKHQLLQTTDPDEFTEDEET